MKRTDITELFPDAPKDAIDKLMGINGADVNAAKAELEDLRRQLAAASNGEELTKAQQQVKDLQDELNGLKKADSIRQIREKVAGETKVPANLLTGETEEACTQQANAILAFAKPGGYPVLRDGGSPTTAGAQTTRDKFASWASENL